MSYLVSPLPMNYWLPVGKALLTATFGAQVILSLRDGRRLEPAFVGLAVGVIGLTFSGMAIEGIQQLSAVMKQDIDKLGDTQQLRGWVWASIHSTGENPEEKQNLLQHLGSQVEFLFRSGVWGVVSTVADFFFLLAEFFIEVRRDVLLSLVQFIFPLIWGLYPLFPGIGNSLTAYIIEMAFWGPCLFLIQLIIGHVAPRYLARPGSLGVPIVALEIVATLMILDIPKTVHQLLRGALHPGGENAALGMIFLGPRTLKQAGAKSAAGKGEFV